MESDNAICIMLSKLFIFAVRVKLSANVSGKGRRAQASKQHKRCSSADKEWRKCDAERVCVARDLLEDTLTIPVARLPN